MNRFAIDTNIMLYSLDGYDIKKQETALKLITAKPYINTQNISEFSNVCLRRWKYPKMKVASLVDIFLEQCNYSTVSKAIISRTSSLIEKYDLQFFDSIIVSAALESECSILYSEDMHHQLLIENKLQIINPFIQP